jgi:hypothetical protein
MPDISLPPMNQCSMHDASNVPDTEGTVVPPSPTLVTSEPVGEELADAAGGRAGSEALVRRFSGEGAGQELPEVTQEPPFERGCGADALRAVGACGAMVLTAPAGPAFVLSVVSCASSLWALDECVGESAAPR